MAQMQTFNCPRCGGNLAYPSGSTEPNLTCQYCGSTIPVPDELRAPGLQARASAEAIKYGRWLIIFILLVVGVPTCLGIGGTLIGIAASILAPLIAIFAAFAHR